MRTKSLIFLIATFTSIPWIQYGQVIQKPLDRIATIEAEIDRDHNVAKGDLVYLEQRSQDKTPMIATISLFALSKLCKYGHYKEQSLLGLARRSTANATPSNACFLAEMTQGLLNLRDIGGTLNDKAKYYWRHPGRATSFSDKQWAFISSLTKSGEQKKAIIASVIILEKRHLHQGEIAKCLMIIRKFLLLSHDEHYIQYWTYVRGVFYDRNIANKKSV